MKPDKAKREYNDGVEKLLNDVQRILDQNGWTYADLARDIKRSYHQTYAWMKVRKFNPSGKGIMLLSQWRNRHTDRPMATSLIAIG